jgi:hypothetical protein
MSLNSQVPYLYSVIGNDGEVLTITNAKSVSCYTSGAPTDITNSNGQVMSLPDGVTIEMNADTGNTLSTIVITPNTGATAYVTMLGGNGIVA